MRAYRLISEKFYKVRGLDMEHELSAWCSGLLSPHRFLDLLAAVELPMEELVTLTSAVGSLESRRESDSLRLSCYVAFSFCPPCGIPLHRERLGQSTVLYVAEVGVCVLSRDFSLHPGYVSAIPTG